MWGWWRKYSRKAEHLLEDIVGGLGHTPAEKAEGERPVAARVGDEVASDAAEALAEVDVGRVALGSVVACGKDPFGKLGRVRRHVGVPDRRWSAQATGELLVELLNESAGVLLLRDVD